MLILEVLVVTILNIMDEFDNSIASVEASNIPKENRFYIMHPSVWELAKQRGEAEERNGTKYVNGIETISTILCDEKSAYLFDKRNCHFDLDYTNDSTDVPSSVS